MSGRTHYHLTALFTDRSAATPPDMGYDLRRQDNARSKTENLDTCVSNYLNWISCKVTEATGKMKNCPIVARVLRYDDTRRAVLRDWCRETELDTLLSLFPLDPEDK